jgi:hypothetical protein
LYQYEGQNQDAAGPNAALLSRFPNGVFATLEETDADVKTMCAFEKGGTLQGIVFGGNFTSVGGLHTPGGIALLNPDDGSVSPLEGLNGSVNALFCDADAGQVYIGGSFTGGNSSNAIVWKDDWTNMPFSGFNGPVYSIVQSNGKIIFGGEFNGLGGNETASGPAQNNTQVLPIGSANLTAQTSSGRPGLTDPKNIVCKADAETQGSDSTWLLADNSPGFWRADFGFGFMPTMLRLHNTDFEGRGTKTWRYTALPDGGIMNFSYVDPTGEQRFCDATCPLPEGNTSAQNFEFVNDVGMNSFRIDISDWYGQGGGLNGIELFQNGELTHISITEASLTISDIYTFAINDFNEPQCGGVTTGASSTPTGPWQNTPSHDSNSQYLTATLQGSPVDPNEATVVFEPDIKQTGNYSMLVFTPGCRGDGTCGIRGRVNITGTMTSSNRTPLSAEIFQTNEFDKYDTIYTGFIDATDGFRPSVTLRPSDGQTGPLAVVAQRIRFRLEGASAGNLNGLFEYDPNQQEVDTDFGKSVINTAGADLRPQDRALVTTLAATQDRLYVGGNFSNDAFSNIFAIDNGASNASALAGNGLNSQVMTIYQNGSSIYVGGNFTNTQNNGNEGLNGVAFYSNDQWRPLGAGVDGVVTYLVPFTLNITADSPEEVLAVSGFFNRVNGFGNNAAFSTENFAVWVPSRGNWLDNLDIGGISLHGTLLAYTDVPGADPVFAGSMTSQALGARGAAILNTGNPLSLYSFPGSAIQAQQQQASLSKRSLTDDQNLTTTGIVTAAFYHENDMNKTILAGHFAVTGTDGQNITSLLVIDSNDSDRVTGLGEEIDSNSTFAALGTLDNVLFAGGSMSGTAGNARLAGILAWDLSANILSGTQPPALQGTNVTVNAIIPRPKSKDVFVGGRFESAGALSCPALCIWNAERNQWISPGGDLTGVVTSLLWVSDTQLLIAGNLTSGNNQTKIMTYDSSKSEFAEFTGAEDLPGPVTALCPANRDSSQIWASGQAADGSVYLRRFDGKTWTDINTPFGPGTNIRGLQILSLNNDHDESDLISQDQDLLIMGQINITDFGTASAVLYNGTSLIPFLLSTNADNEPGSLSQVFVENPQSFFKSGSKCSLFQSFFWYWSNNNHRKETRSRLHSPDCSRYRLGPHVPSCSCWHSFGMVPQEGQRILTNAEYISGSKHGWPITTGATFRDLARQPPTSHMKSEYDVHACTKLDMDSPYTRNQRVRKVKGVQRSFIPLFLVNPAM